MSARTNHQRDGKQKLPGLLMGHDGPTGNLWAVLYSPSQRAYHLCQIDEMLRGNQRMMAQGGITDYIPIYFSTSQGHASDLCDMCKAIWGRPGTAQAAYRRRLRKFTNNN